MFFEILMIVMITSVEPVVDKAGRYSIKETSSLLGIHRHTLRAYVQAGLIHPVCSRAALRMGMPRQRFLGAEIVRFWRSFA